MALVTKHLGFGLTASLSFEHPYTFARRLSTLDHLTKGRAGWNIVTSYLDSGAKNIGLGGQSAHDDRYDVADEYMEVCYKLWEGSWEDDAVLRDRTRRIFTDPTKVHPIRHEGRYFKVPGVHLSEPSPQRTPVLYQAGASARGRRFAGEHAECVFIATPSKAVLKKSVAANPRKRRRGGPRSAERPHLQSCKPSSSMRPTPRRRRNTTTISNISTSTARWRSVRDGWGSISAGTSRMSPCAISRPTRCNRRSKPFPALIPSKVWTVRELAEWIGIGGLGPLFVGGPQTVADLIEEWVEDTDVDGFNLAYAVTHETFSDIVDAPCPRTAEARPLQARLRAGNAAREAFWRRAALAQKPMSARAIANLASLQPALDAAE